MFLPRAEGAGENITFIKMKSYNFLLTIIKVAIILTLWEFMMSRFGLLLLLIIFISGCTLIGKDTTDPGPKPISITYTYELVEPYSAKFSWTLSSASNSTFFYSTTNDCNIEFTPETADNINYSVNLTGLLENTFYYCKITADGGKIESSIKIFRTPSFIDDIIITNIINGSITPRDFIITFDTNQTTSCTILYGINTTYGNSIATMENGISHSAQLVGLEPDTDYYYKIIATSMVPGYVSTEQVGTMVRTEELWEVMITDIVIVPGAACETHWSTKDYNSENGLKTRTNFYRAIFTDSYTDPIYTPLESTTHNHGFSPCIQGEDYKIIIEAIPYDFYDDTNAPCAPDIEACYKNTMSDEQTFTNNY